ncbi:MAG: exodeoxyribonuclease VII small subunit [Oscillospiraceae bacterium]
MAKSFEDNITRLEEIVSQLERGDAKLADSLKLLRRGRSSSPPAEKCSTRRSRRSCA